MVGGTHARRRHPIVPVVLLCFPLTLALAGACMLPAAASATSGRLDGWSMIDGTHHTYDAFTDVVTAPDGSVVATIGLDGDSLQIPLGAGVVKYAADGSKAWQHDVTVPHIAVAEVDPVAVVADPSGKVAVVADYMSATGAGVCVNVWSADGAFLWSQTMAGAYGDQDWARDIGMDELGNVYVAGGRVAASSAKAAWVAKFAAPTVARGAASLAWKKEIPAVGDWWDTGTTALCITRSGGVFAAGMYRSALKVSRAFLYHYSTDGDLVWARSWLGTRRKGVKSAVAQSMVLRGTTLDVCGDQLDSPGGTDFTVRSYTTAGHLRWQHVWGHAHLEDNARTVRLDGHGSLYVLGTRQTNQFSSHARWVLTKWSGSGHVQWVSDVPGEPSYYVPPASRLAVDAAGNAWVASTVKAHGIQQWEIVRLSAAGKRLWKAEWAGIPTLSPLEGAVATACTLGGQGRLVVVGAVSDQPQMWNAGVGWYER